MTEPTDLSGGEKRNIAIEAGIQMIPYVGGSLCTLYFGSKQEKRFKRLETFYAEIAAELRQTKEPIRTIEQQDPEALEAIMESLHEKVEAEPTSEKRAFFKNYLKSTLRFPVAGNFDERKHFLDTLAEMTLLECELVAFVNAQSAGTKVGNIQKPATDQYAIVGAIGRLKSRGFLTATQNSFSVGGGDNSLQEIVSISPYGESFYSFCLST